MRKISGNVATWLALLGAAVQALSQAPPAGPGLDPRVPANPLRQAYFGDLHLPA
jgi:hypothetical protein